MSLNKLLFITIYISILFIFLRDFIIVVEYFLLYDTIPFYKIDVISTGIIIYLKDIAIIVSNLILTIFLFKKNKKIIQILLFFILFLFFNIALSINNLSLLQIASDIRILNSIYFITMLFSLIKYYIKKNHIFPIEKILKLYLLLSLIDAIVSLIEFYIIGMSLGSRIMGLFSVAALNAYVLFYAQVILSILFLYKKVSKIKFIILSNIYFIAILTTGTRVVIFGYIILLSWVLFQLLIKNKSVHTNLKKIFMLLLPIAMLLISIFAINTANNTAQRGDVLNQSDRGRISKLINITNTLEERNRIFFGEGVGWGSNVVSSLLDNVPSNYKSVDGSIQFILIHNGIIGLLLIIFISMFMILKTQQHNKYNVITLLLPIILIALSVNVLEQTIVLIAFGLSMSFTYQQEYIKRNFKK